MTGLPRRHLRRDRRRQRGAVYLAVLGASMIITVIGVSALLAVRVQRHAAQANQDATEARVLAQSAIELALHRLAGDPGWRRTYTHDVWTAAQPLGGGTCSFKLVDRSDSSLSDDWADRVWLYGRGEVGQAVRITRVLLQPEATLPGANLLDNPDMEGGTRHWLTESGYAELAYTDADQHTGEGTLLVFDRTRAWAGANQDVTGRVENGRPYRLEARVRLLAGSDAMKLQFHSRALLSGDRWDYVITPTVGTTWTHVTATITPTWSGDLAWLHWEVQATNTTADFLVDDAVLLPASALHTMVPVPGTWQQVVATTP